MTEFFQPASIAIVGASNHKDGQRIETVRKRGFLSGFQGIFPLNIELITGILAATADFGKPHPMIEQINLNPVAVQDAESVVVDAGIALGNRNPGRGLADAA